MSSVSTDTATLWENRFPQFIQSNDKGVRSIVERAKAVTIPAQHQIIAPGTKCEHYLLVAKGSIRVQMLTETGREMVLYHLRAGDTCVLTISCLLSGDPFPAEGITESEVTVLTVLAADFAQALEHSALFRRFVFTKFGQRLAQVISRIEEISSVPIDRRLAAVLVCRCTGEQPVSITHRELASELGTAREVVSRHLKRFESLGWVHLGRGTIEIKALEVLVSISEG